MISIRHLTFLILLVTFLLAACDSNSEPDRPTPIPSLRGAVVPTRATPTPTITPTPSNTATNTPSPTVDFEATANSEVTATARQELVLLETQNAEATATANEVFTLAERATSEALSTATADARSTADAQSTIDRQAFLDSQATLNAQIATLDAIGTLNAEATTQALNARATVDAQSTLDSIATIDAQATTDARATADAQITPSPTATTEIRTSSRNTLTYGDTTSGTISDTSPVIEFTFEGQADDTVTIELNNTSGDLDPFLVLVGPNGDELIDNDDNALESGTRDSLIDRFELPSSGTYTILATRFSRDIGTTQGNFSLTLTSGGGTTISTGERITYGDRVSNEIRGNTSQFEYTFEAAAGDVINIQMNALSGDLDTLIVLLNPDGIEIVSNDDDPQGNGTTNSYLRDYTIPTRGIHTIIATRFSRDIGLTQGEFELILAKANSGTEPSSTPATSQTLRTLATFSGEITATNHYQLFTFEGQENLTVTITMDEKSGDLDPFLLLLSPEGRELARNDDRADGDFNSTLDNILLTENGEYTIVAARYRKLFGTSSGDFEIEVTETIGTTDIALISQPTELDTTLQGEITTEHDQSVYTFAAQMGDLVTIEMIAGNNELDPFLILENHFGDEIIRNDDNVYADNISNALLPSVLIPEDGIYTIIGTTYIDNDGNYASGDFDLSISRDSTETEIHHRAVINPFFSEGSREDDFSLIYYAVGDWTDAENNDLKVSALVTYHLPVLSEGATVSNAILNLGECYYSGTGDAFEIFGTLSVYLNAVFTKEADLSDGVNAAAQEVDTLNECRSVDITQAIQQAYQNGATSVQFRYAFAEGEPLNNGNIDSLIFTNPYLEIQSN